MESPERGELKKCMSSESTYLHSIKLSPHEEEEEEADEEVLLV
jgi:hypothetical protein